MSVAATEQQAELLSEARRSGLSVFELAMRYRQALQAVYNVRDGDYYNCFMKCIDISEQALEE